MAGGKLKEAGTLHWQSPNANATDESGFNALPNGSRHMTGSFTELGQRAVWWCYDEDHSSFPDREAYYQDIQYNYALTSSGTSPLTFGFGVRCRLTLN